MECIVEPRYNEVPRDWQNFLAIKRFRYIGGTFPCISSCHWGKQNHSLYRLPRYIEGSNVFDYFI